MLYASIAIVLSALSVLIATSSSESIENMTIKGYLSLLRSRYVAWCSENKYFLFMIEGMKRPIQYLSSKASALATIYVATLIPMMSGIALGLIFKSYYGFIFGLFGSVAFFVLKGKAILSQERKALVNQIPDVFRTMAMMLASGKTLMQTCAYIARETRGKISDAFSSCAMSLQLGESRDVALSNLCKSLDLPCMKLVACSLEISQLTGAPLQDLLLKVALLVEEEENTIDYIQVKTAQAQASVKVVVLLPILIVSTLALISQDFRNGLMSAVGISSIFMAAFLDFTAVLIIRKQMQGVESDVIS